MTINPSECLSITATAPQYRSQRCATLSYSLNNKIQIHNTLTRYLPVTSTPLTVYCIRPLWARPMPPNACNPYDLPYTVSEQTYP